MADPATSPTECSGLPGWRAWRELLQDGALTGGDHDPDATSAALVRHWHQRFAVAIDGPLEQAATGAQRLPQIVHAWLDLARASTRIRAYVEACAGDRTARERNRQSALLLGVLGEDLALIGVPDPAAAAAALLLAMQEVALEEDRAGRVLPDRRAAALRSAGVEVGTRQRFLHRRVLRCSRPVAVAWRRSARATRGGAPGAPRPPRRAAA